MTKAELTERIAYQIPRLPAKEVDLVVRSILEQLSQSITCGQRIEIRGFGSFSLHGRGPRTGRNPKTGDAVQLVPKLMPHFKPGKELRDRVNAARKRIPITR